MGEGAEESPPPSQRVRRGSFADRRGIPGGLEVSTADANVNKVQRLVEGQSIHGLYEVSDGAYQAFSSRAVYPCKCKRTGREFVLKMKRKKTNSSGAGEDGIFRETLDRIMNMSCDHLLNFEGVYEDELHFYMVMPKCNSGELFQLLVTEDSISERECKRIIREILTGIHKIHDSGLIHRDIKPENVLLHAEEPESPKSPKSLKIIDFDTTRPFDPQSPVTKSKGVVGTHGYIAPEGYLGEYTPRSDLWSVGVILYVLMTGEMPHSNRIYDGLESDDNTVGNGIEKMYQALQTAQVDWECEPWPQFPLARDLCQQLMAFEPEARTPSAADALKHAWLQPRSSQRFGALLGESKQGLPSGEAPTPT